jgi:hypothetical protein
MSFMIYYFSILFSSPILPLFILILMKIDFKKKLFFIYILMAVISLSGIFLSHILFGEYSLFFILLTVFLLFFSGRSFCMACPVGKILQSGVFFSILKIKKKPQLCNGCSAGIDVCPTVNTHFHPHLNQEKKQAAYYAQALKSA